MAVFIFNLFAIILILYDLLDIITFLSIKVNYSPYSIHYIAIIRLFLFSLNNFGSISNKSLVALVV